MCLMAICVSSLKQVYLGILAVLIGLFVIVVLLLPICRSRLHILDNKPLLVSQFANTFSHCVDCLCGLFMFSLAVQNFISLIRSCLYIFLFLLTWWTDLENNDKLHVQRMFCPCSLLWVSWCHVLYWSLYATLFLCMVRVCSNFTDVHVAIHLFQHLLLKGLCFPCLIFLLSLSKIS